MVAGALAVALVGCGSVGSVVRPTDEVVYLKIKDGLAQELFEGLAGVPEPLACPDSERPCKRQGEHIICSTANVRDPVVCEVRLSADGALLAAVAELYHSAEANRFSTTTVLDGSTLRLTGAGAEELRRLFAPGTEGAIEFEVVDAAAGRLGAPGW